ncbi:EscJ/YscJ/HrcJ family type III secretion inner membrane ring protein [Paraburkholderia sp. Tr-20389]|uniref:type III secretion system inner membrane ring lipoprotein SctJ n=1 Tax=Paraburkholderia sp. Tr-20389 TaxID=2703903 RepID=UPI00197D849E|nr:type III secretion inner membrane ring lipoprotein SctJ [Paraburkholderia sp. Tr-20389]MBN3754977.1 EscJ/YscJ/HrcJ family type III secretion inner membrane ring protein [Paraburkholderia sp. Tr-20389]
MRRVLILLPLLLLVGCKASLFESLEENQANQVIAVLSQHGIEGVKERNADKTWNVSVDADDVVTATEITREYALPHGNHANLGDLFSRQGLISNPDEDRVRYVYGLTQELSETLEKIDGVLVARVHIVQPERDPLNRQVTPPSASVMLRYRSDYNLEYMRDKIRGLVAGSVEGLTPDHVYLTFIPVTPIAEPVDAKGGADAHIAAGTGGSRHDATLTMIVLTVMGMLLILSVWVWDSGIRSFTPTFFRRRKLKRAAKKRAEEQSETNDGGDAS